MSELRVQLRRLHEIVTGIPAEATDDERLAAIQAQLFSEELSESERSFLAEQASQGGDGAVLESLVERRLQRVLGALDGAPPVLLDPGVAQTFLESVARTSDVPPDADAADSLADAITAAQRPHEDQAERIERTVASAGRALILTDSAGVRELEQSVPAAEFHTESSRQKATDWTSARIDVVEAGDTLAEMQRVMLWSVPAKEREGILRRAVRDSLVGAILGGKYEILEKRGRGGFGTVYRAKDRILGAEVAVKVLNARYQRAPEAMRSFLSEAKRLTSVDHPNIVRWITFDRTNDGLHYFVMEYLGSGEELSALLRREGKLSPERAGELLLQVLSALRCTHDLPDGRSLLHLDLKPQNILVLPGSQARGEQAKVIDFGISRTARDEALASTLLILPSLEREGEMTLARPRSGSSSKRPGASTIARIEGGTPLYASPEQCRHISGADDIVELDGRTDLYSLGVVAFEMLAGELPFKRPANQREAVICHLRVPPRKLLDLAPEVPKDLAAWVHRCLEKDREARFETSDEAYRALESILHPPQKAARWIGWSVLAAGIVAAALVLSFLRGDADQLVGCTVALAEGSVELGGSVLRVPAGDAEGRWITPKDVTPDGAGIQGASLVDGKGQAVEGVEVEWVPERGAFRLLHENASVEPGLRTRRAVQLAWNDAEARRSPGFELVVVAPPTWPGIGAEEPLRVVDDKGSRLADWDPSGRPLLVDGLSLRVALRGPLDNLATSEPVCLVLADGRRVPLGLRPVRGDELLFDVALVDLLDEGLDLDGEAELVVEDYFGRTLSRPTPLRLTARGPQLVLDDLEWRTQAGARQRLTLAELGPAAGFHRSPGGPGQLVVRARLAAAERGTRLTVSFAGRALDGVDSARLGQGIELTIPGDQLGERGNLELTADDRGEVRARDERLLLDTTVCSLRFLDIPPVDWTLEGDPAWGLSGSAPRLELFPQGYPRVRRGEYRLRVSGELDGWFAGLALDGAPLLPGGVQPLEAAGLELPFDFSNLGRPGLRLDLDLYPPASLRAEAGRAPSSDDPALVRLTAQLEFDDGLSIVQLDARTWSPDADSLRLAGEGEPLRAARCLLRPAGADPGVELDTRPVVLGDASDGTLTFEAADWGGAAAAPADGAYVLVVQGADAAGNLARLELATVVNRGGPLVELARPAPRREWLPDADGLFPLELRVSDGNGVVPPAEVRVELASGALLEPCSGCVWTSSAASTGEAVDAIYTTRVALPRDSSGQSATLEILVRDALGLGQPTRFDVRIGDVPLPAQVARSGQRDTTPMRLVDPRGEGAYVFGELDRAAYQRALEERGVHWADGADFDSVCQRFATESPPQVLVPYADFAPYYLDQHEVSRGQYARFLDDDQAGYLSPAAWEGSGLPWSAQVRSERHAYLSGVCASSPELPIDAVTWSEAWAYARWAGKRLPTYLEWEFAVRGSEGRLFAAERPVEAAVRRVGAAAEATFRVYAEVTGALSEVDAGFDVSPLGLLHLCGNVAEWTSTAWRDPKGSGLDDVSTPFDPKGGLSGLRFWIVGADCRERYTGRVSGRADLPEHDFKATAKKPHDFNDRPGRAPVGFRCAIDADGVAQSPGDWTYP